MTNTTISVQPGVLMPSNCKTKTWSSGLCDCCEDMGICCLGMCCSWHLMCTTSHEFGECYCLPLLDIYLGTLVPPVAYSLRSAIRERYRIQGTMCDDCCVVTFCRPCAWCQMAREVKFQRQAQGVVSTQVNVTYQAPPNMPQQPLMNQSYQQPPMNPGYQPLQQNNPPVYAQPSKVPDAQAGGLYPAV